MAGHLGLAGRTHDEGAADGRALVVVAAPPWELFTGPPVHEIASVSSKSASARLQRPSTEVASNSEKWQKSDYKSDDLARRVGSRRAGPPMAHVPFTPHKKEPRS